MKYGLLACALLCATCARAQYDAELPQVITVASMGLQGDVAEMAETYTGMQAEEGIGMITQRHIYVFDKAGRLVSETEITPAGKRNKDEGKLARRYRYDKEGNLLSVTGYGGERKQDSAAMHYDHRNRLIRRYVYDSKDRMEKWVQYTWNKQGRLMTVRHRDSDNEIVCMIKVQHSHDGNTIEYTHLGEELKFLHKVTMVTKSDTSGGISIMRFEYNKPDTCTGMSSYTLNAHGCRIAETVMDEQKNVTEYSTTTYDAHNNPDSTIQYTTDKILRHYLHTYDDHGNWVVQAVYQNNRAYYTRGRSIVYR